jgi:hypothetical protein
MYVDGNRKLKWRDPFLFLVHSSHQLNYNTLPLDMDAKADPITGIEVWFHTIYGC